VREGDLRGGVGGHGGDAGVAADPEKLEADGDPGELGADRADIGDHERGQRGTSTATVSDQS